MGKSQREHSNRPSSQAPRSSSRSGAQKWGFRLAAGLLVPLLMLGLLETLLRLAGFGYPTAFFLRRPINGRPALIENEKFGWRFFSPAAARAPRIMAVPEMKPPQCYRIFVFGESAAYGDPQPDFGLPRMLEVLLRAHYPGVQFEVINAAMTAVNSHVVLPIARDCARQNGDLWIIYLGNNEVIGPYGAGTVFGPQVPSLAFIRGSLALKTTRVGQMLDKLWLASRNYRAADQEWGGLRMFIKHQVRLEDPRMAAVYQHFQHNVRDILQTGLDCGVPMIVSTVASNLKDCAPFASLHRSDLTGLQQAEWNRLYQAGIDAQKTARFAEAADLFGQAAQIDDRFAELQFRWGACCLALPQETDARRHFALARDYDALRFRADSRINDIIRALSDNRGQQRIYFVDSQAALARQSSHGLPGEELFYEHVHLNFTGNYWLARALADQVAKQLPSWITARAPAKDRWPSLTECAQNLAWTDWNRSETLESLLIRLNDPPFTSQLNHTERCRRLQNQLEQLLPAIQPAALRLAAAAYQRAIERRPDDWILRFNYARLQQKLGNLAGALESWQRVAQWVPHHSQALCQIGSLLSQQGHLDEGIRQFETVLRQQPDSAQALNGLGLALAQQGKYPEALRAYQKVLHIKPHDFETSINAGNALMALGKPEEARIHFRAALQHKPNNPNGLLVLGNICLGQGWISEAIALYAEALRLAPTDAMAHLTLGNALAKAGQVTEARPHFAEAVRLNPDYAEAHFLLGLDLGRQGRDAEALAQFAEAVRLKPGLTEAHVNLGIALMKQQRPEEAARHFQEALRLDPSNAIARKYLESIHPQP